MRVPGDDAAGFDDKAAHADGVGPGSLASGVSAMSRADDAVLRAEGFVIGAVERAAVGATDRRRVEDGFERGVRSGRAAIGHTGDRIGRRDQPSNNRPEAKPPKVRATCATLRQSAFKISRSVRSLLAGFKPEAEHHYHVQYENEQGDRFKIASVDDDTDRANARIQVEGDDKQRRLHRDLNLRADAGPCDCTRREAVRRRCCSQAHARSRSSVDHNALEALVVGAIGQADAEDPDCTGGRRGRRPRPWRFNAEVISKRWIGSGFTSRPLRPRRSLASGDATRTIGRALRARALS